MERTRRKCINPDSIVSFKAAEKESQDTGILGTALIAPTCQYQQRVRETQFGFIIDENWEGHVTLKDKVSVS